MIHCAVCDSKIYPVLAYQGIGKKREDGRAHACISACFGEALILHKNQAVGTRTSVQQVVQHTLKYADSFVNR